MPLQSNSKGLIASTSEVSHIIKQLKSLPEAPANFPTLTLGPVPYSGGCKKGIIPKHKGGLPPSSRRRGGGSHVKPNLHSWASTANRLLDHHSSCGRSWRSLFRPSRRLVSMVKSFAIMGGWRRLFSVLGLLLLCGRATTRHKSVISHSSMDYHLVFGIFGFRTWGIDLFDLYLLSSWGFSTLLLDRYIYILALKNSISWPIPCRYQRIYSYQPGAKISSFTDRQYWRKKASVPYVYVWQQWTTYCQSLPRGWYLV